MNISISDDLDLQKIAYSGQCFRVREFEDGLFRFVTGSEVLYIKNYQLSALKLVALKKLGIKYGFLILI